MLCVNNYSQHCIDDCRSKITDQISAYQTLIAAARNQTAADEPRQNTSIEAYEPRLFNNMLLGLNEAGFTRLSSAFFEEIERKYLWFSLNPSPPVPPAVWPMFITAYIEEK